MVTLNMKRLTTLACLAFITICFVKFTYSQTSILELPLNGKAFGFGYQRFYVPDNYRHDPSVVSPDIHNSGQNIKGIFYYSSHDDFTFSLSAGLNSEVTRRLFIPQRVFFSQGTIQYKISPPENNFGFFAKGAITGMLGEQYYDTDYGSGFTVRKEAYIPRVGVGIFYKRFPDVRPFVGFFFQHVRRYHFPFDESRDLQSTETFTIGEFGVGIDIGEMLNMTSSIEVPFDARYVVFQITWNTKF